VTPHDVGSRYERQLLTQIGLEGLPTPEVQHCPIKGRRFRLDFAWPDRKLAAEVDGGRWMVRRSSKTGQAVPVGYHNSKADYDKLNLVALEGWTVLRFNPEMVRSGEAIRLLKEVLMR